MLQFILLEKCEGRILCTSLAVVEMETEMALRKPTFFTFSFCIMKQISRMGKLKPSHFILSHTGRQIKSLDSSICTHLSALARIEQKTREL